MTVKKSHYFWHLSLRARRTQKEDVRDSLRTSIKRDSSGRLDPDRDPNRFYYPTSVRPRKSAAFVTEKRTFVWQVRSVRKERRKEAPSMCPESDTWRNLYVSRKVGCCGISLEGFSPSIKTTALSVCSFPAGRRVKLLRCEPLGWWKEKVSKLRNNCKPGRN